MSEVDGRVFGQSVGYGMIVGVGFAFAIVMVGVTKILSKYFNENQNSEMLMTANRSIKIGLVASAVFSSWTIGSTLLLSVTETYLIGTSASFYYGAGACVQIIFFAILALRLKLVAPNAHSYLELVYERYGAPTHIVGICYSLIQIVCYTTNLLINGSSIFRTITGINRDASTVLFPIGVIIYTLLGGIKATFLTDWTHTIIIYAILMTFMFNCFTTNDSIGSADKMWELLVEAGERRQIAGNLEGSLLTFHSVQGGLFLLVLVGAGFAASVDPQLFQKAIAADAKSLTWGYILGGLAWFTLPFCLATTLGNAASALETSSVFPTYPNLMSAAQIGDGLTMPFAAEALMGRSGVSMVLVMVFMAVTAAFSSETMALSAMVVHDIYKRYFNPEAKGRRLIFVADSSVIVFGIVTVGLGIGLAHAGFDVSFITTASGIIVNVNVVAIVFTLYWKKMSPLGYIGGTIGSTLIAFAVWFGYTVSQSGYISLATLSTNEALAAGNIVAVGCPLVLVPILVFIKPSNFDFDKWLEIKQDDNADYNEAHGIKNVLSRDEITKLVLEERMRNDRDLRKHTKIGYIFGAIFILFFLILFPMPLYGTKYVFSKSFFRGYVVVMFIWAFLGAVIIICLPIWDARHAFIKLWKIIVLGKKEEQPVGDIYFVKSLEGRSVSGSDVLETDKEQFVVLEKKL